MLNDLLAIYQENYRVAIYGFLGKVFTFVMSRIQCKKKKNFNLEIEINFAAGSLQTEYVEFVYDGWRQIFLPTVRQL